MKNTKGQFLKTRPIQKEKKKCNIFAEVGIIAIAFVELHEALNFKAVKQKNHYTRLIFESWQKKIVK